MLQEMQLNEIPSYADQLNAIDGIEPGDDEGNREDYPETDDLDDETLNGDEEEITTADEDESTDEDLTDPSANDIDGNGGYPDAANPTELSS
ncbi:hypothetical protein [Mucilaginibacter sp. HD30]